MSSGLPNNQASCTPVFIIVRLVVTLTRNCKNFEVVESSTAFYCQQVQFSPLLYWGWLNGGLKIFISISHFNLAYNVYLVCVYIFPHGGVESLAAFLCMAYVDLC